MFSIFQGKWRKCRRDTLDTVTEGLLDYLEKLDLLGIFQKNCAEQLVLHLVQW